MLIKKPIFAFAPIIGALVLMLSSCGQSNSSDDSKSPKASIGVFIDSYVAGLGYKAKSFSGKTNTKGEFKYAEGEMITFSIGNIILGSQYGAPILSPLSLVPGAKDELDSAVTNIVRLLMTLDVDKNALNGIRIADETSQIAEQVADDAIDFSAPDFSVNPDLNGFLTRLPSPPVLVDSITAQAHFSETLKSQSNWGSLVWGSGTWKSSVTDL